MCVTERDRQTDRQTETETERGGVYFQKSTVQVLSAVIGLGSANSLGACNSEMSAER